MQNNEVLNVQNLMATHRFLMTEKEILESRIQEIENILENFTQGKEDEGNQEEILENSKIINIYL